MTLGCGLTSVRGNRGENYENAPLVRQKHTKKKNNLKQKVTLMKVFAKIGKQKLHFNAK
jgi:hypothetical protein